MPGETKKRSANIKQTVPFFAVSNMETSLRFYTEGLGFEIKYKWVPHDKIEWCFLQRDSGTLMLQQPRKDDHHPGMPEGKLGVGISIFFICEDALAIYHELIAKCIDASEPFVSNTMWLTSLKDPDGYSIEFESSTDTPEGTLYSDYKQEIK